ncbi:MAG: Flp/Fap pilin component [Candidatus Eremiobacteraeota bacterium]|jgi:Flp pilus assembly pilin Flp|nr:Flp/Fap pilin component [Candidatus Eremiobacteraeota bacterium]
MKTLLALLRDERGAALTEYALVLAVIALASITALAGLSGQLSKTLQNLTDTLFAAQTGP